MELSKEEEKSIRVEILKVISEFCDEHNLTYFLAFGTLLGAIREKGMIAWDYDIDVMLPRQDFENFINMFSESNDGRYRVKHHRLDKRFICPIAIVEDLQTYNLTLKEMDENDPLKRINVELYPIDGAPESRVLYKSHIIILDFLNNILKVKVSKNDSKRKLYKKIILDVLRIVAFPISSNVILSVIDRLALMYDFDSCRYSSISTIGKLGLKTYNDKNIYGEFYYAEYEGYSFRVPYNSHLWLSKRYGDYSKKPSKKEIEKSLKLKNYYQYGVMPYKKDKGE